MNQRPLFEKYREPYQPTDPHVEDCDKPRLAGQNSEMLAMLRRGPKTNAAFQLAGMLKYTSRISDLRKAGYKITATRLSGGLFLYTLEP